MQRLIRLRHNHLLMSAVYKGFSGLSLFVSITLLIKYLGDTGYGFWILISTLFQWVLLMDLGLASVLKTKIPELQVKGSSAMLNAYIRATYEASIKIAFGLFLLFGIFAIFGDIKGLFNIPYDSGFIIRIFLLNLFFFCTAFVMNTHKALFVSVHKGKFAEQSLAVNQFGFLLTLGISIVFVKNIDIYDKLYLVSYLNGFVCILVNLLYTVYFFRTEAFQLFSKDKLPTGYFSEVYRLGAKYMLMQTGTLMLFSSDNYILSYFYNPKEIVPYEIISKYFHFPLLIITAGMAPLWSMFTKHYFEGDSQWLRKSFVKFNYFYIIVLAAVVGCTLIAPWVIKLWIGKDFRIDRMLLIVIAVMTSLRIFSNFYSYFFFGIGNLRNYLILLTISVILKIPITYIFIQAGYGISSVVISSSLFLIFWVIVQPIEAHKLVSNMRLAKT